MSQVRSLNFSEEMFVMQVAVWDGLNGVGWINSMVWDELIQWCGLN